jgi:hypothetical protein
MLSANMDYLFNSVKKLKLVMEKCGVFLDFYLFTVYLMALFQ